MNKMHAFADAQWLDHALGAGVSSGAFSVDYGAGDDDYGSERPHKTVRLQYAQPKSGAVGDITFPEAPNVSDDAALSPTVTSIELTSIALTAGSSAGIELDVPAGYWHRLRAVLARAPELPADVDIDDEPIL